MSVVTLRLNNVSLGRVEDHFSYSSLLVTSIASTWVNNTSELTKTPNKEFIFYFLIGLLIIIHGLNEIFLSYKKTGLLLYLSEPIELS